MPTRVSSVHRHGITGRRYRWRLKTFDPSVVADLSERTGWHPIQSMALVHRGLTDVENVRRYLACPLDEVHDPFALHELDRCVQRLTEARKKGDRVIVFGDYDVDGLTATAMMTRVLSEAGLHVTPVIPHRFAEGYGLSPKSLKRLKTLSPDVVLCVDCGVSAHDPIRHLMEAGVDVLVVDHHEPPIDGRVPALAVVNPKQSVCGYPDDDLTAAGLCLKLIHAWATAPWVDHLDLAALGTIADVAPLTGENRIIAKHGLDRLANTRRAGLRALKATARLGGRPIDPTAVSFVLAPRLNATGRMGSADLSLQLLLCDDDLQALRLAQNLERFNQSRQRLQNALYQEALAMIERDIHFKDDHVIVLSGAGWHRGVLGIVAAKIAQEFQRPTVMIGCEEGVGVGSARSVMGFPLKDMLDACRDLLEAYGGHAAAAGLTLAESNIESLRRKANELARAYFESRDRMPELLIDAEVPLSFWNESVMGWLKGLEPFGEGNPPMIVLTRRLHVTAVRFLGRATMKITVVDESGASLDLVGFGWAKDPVNVGATVDAVYEPHLNEFKGITRCEGKLKDIRMSEGEG